MRFIQHKAEARWFYRVVSLGYDRWINPLFWTAPMRDAALALARLDDPGLEVVDVGAGTGFATEAIVRTVAPERVTMLDQSPHQLARARRKRALAGVAKVIGDAEALPFATDSRDRYVSTGSIEYWPDPQRAIAEAYRVLRPGGVALLAGPLRRTHPLARALSDAWMLFPAEDEYVAWFERAGFESIERVHVAPDWWDPRWDRYAVAIAGRQAARGRAAARCRRGGGRRRGAARPRCRCASRASRPARSRARPSSPSRCGSRSCASCAGELRPRRRAGARARRRSRRPTRGRCPSSAASSAWTSTPAVTFLVGENGTGKSTLIEALAVCARPEPRGRHAELHLLHARVALAAARGLRPVREARRPRTAFFLRAESCTVATEIERLDEAGPTLPLCRSVSARTPSALPPPRQLRGPTPLAPTCWR